MYEAASPPWNSSVKPDPRPETYRNEILKGSMLPPLHRVYDFRAQVMPRQKDDDYGPGVPVTRPRNVAERIEDVEEERPPWSIDTHLDPREHEARQWAGLIESFAYTRARRDVILSATGYTSPSETEALRQRKLRELKAALKTDGRSPCATQREVLDAVKVKGPLYPPARSLLPDAAARAHADEEGPDPLTHPIDASHRRQSRRKTRSLSPEQMARTRSALGGTFGLSVDSTILGTTDAAGRRRRAVEHNGVWTDTLPGGGAGWSCCLSSDHDAPGCTRKAYMLPRDTL